MGTLSKRNKRKSMGLPKIHIIPLSKHGAWLVNPDPVFVGVCRLGDHWTLEARFNCKGVPRYQQGVHNTPTKKQKRTQTGDMIFSCQLLAANDSTQSQCKQSSGVSGNLMIKYGSPYMFIIVMGARSCHLVLMKRHD